ncbi:unnamed protein product [Echinostoma caproni]|uniref:Krueppel-like factor 15 n=1 Tax=Echinostoma caproni TaxID=27848 RepID=A0A183B5J2_9TREM|nr:unnamed protein product [Echinostoma caproni]
MEAALYSCEDSCIELLPGGGLSDLEYVGNLMLLSEVPENTTHAIDIVSPNRNLYQDPLITLPSGVPSPVSTSISSNGTTCSNSSLFSSSIVCCTVPTLAMTTQVTPALPTVLSSLQSRILAVQNKANIVDLDSSTLSPKPSEDVSSSSIRMHGNTDGNNQTIRRASSAGIVLTTGPETLLPGTLALASR